MNKLKQQTNKNDVNQQQEEQISRKYECKIQYGNLLIGDWQRGDQQIKNLRFIEKFNIQKLMIYVSDNLNIKFRSITINELILEKSEQARSDVTHFNTDDLELENLEVLTLENNKLKNQQLYNLAKFKKLHTLNVSGNNVDLTHIQYVTSLTKLYMKRCGLQNIDQITSLVNLEDLDLSANKGIFLYPLCNLKNLSKLNISECNLKQIDNIGSLTNLEVLNISLNTLENIKSISRLVNLKKLNIMQNERITITPLNDLVGLVKLDLTYCQLKQLNALKPLVNLQILDVSFNSNINITTLQYLKNPTHLYIKCCGLVSVCVLRPLVNLETLVITNNQIVYLDVNFNEITKLKYFQVHSNLLIDLTQIQKHLNFNNLDQNKDVCLDVSYQGIPSQEQLRRANKFRHIERTNIQLKEILNKHYNFKTALNNCKYKLINGGVLNNTNHIQFSSSAAQLSEQLNPPVSQ
ncbi:leucine-rich_repeat domain-containing protein [Hexamita inflata]|uniref:Leucine-rich repeat domain-containing protein n=1 Tax=Hexamita inflata TaxID=28002 RepID=A0AA86N4M9_9EUKA|nr:leucine-rich repeat domain-containing protein [Hexamita inflata]